MRRMLEGIKVVEAAQWVMGPSAAAILADWGASVIRIEHPVRGEPLRGTLPAMGYDTSTFDFYIEQNNHSKRSIGLDLGAPQGREVFFDLVADADVFVTSFLEPARRRWGVTYEDVKAHNPSLIYARTTGQGPRGADAYNPGYDAISYWARSGVGYMAAPEGGRAGPMPAGGFGDVQGGVALAGGIAAALYGRTVSGEGALIDVSLLGVGVWDMYEVLQVANTYGIDPKTKFKPGINPINPLTGVYTSSDRREVALCMIESDRFWSPFCAALELGNVETDPRFDSFAARADHYDELYGIIVDWFSRHDKADVCRRLAAHGCAFAPFKTPEEVLADEQVRANGYLVPHPTAEGNFVVSNPVQFNETFVVIDSPAPEAGQHTEEVLLELGYDWDRILELKDAGVIT